MNLNWMSMICNLVDDDAWKKQNESQLQCLKGRSLPWSWDESFKETCHPIVHFFLSHFHLFLLFCCSVVVDGDGLNWCVSRLWLYRFRLSYIDIDTQYQQRRLLSSFCRYAMYVSSSLYGSCDDGGHNSIEASDLLSIIKYASTISVYKLDNVRVRNRDCIYTNEIVLFKLQIHKIILPTTAFFKIYTHIWRQMQNTVYSVIHYLSSPNYKLFA